MNVEVDQTETLSLVMAPLWDLASNAPKLRRAASASDIPPIRWTLKSFNLTSALDAELSHIATNVHHQPPQCDSHHIAPVHCVDIPPMQLFEHRSNID